MQDRVNVLVTTYNGAQFLREQLESIEVQTWPEICVTIRDDGSTDETTELLEAWAAGRSHVTVLGGSRLGVTKNFLTLLAHPDEESDYFAFADQDDVWLPDKVERAVSALRLCRADEPTMYCTRLEYADERLRHLGYTSVPKRLGFANALVENIATGCTMVMNRCARELVCEKLPDRALIHDWWCYLVVSAFGKVIYDERPSIRYRQHENNLTGGTPSRMELFMRRSLRFLRYEKGRPLVSDQAAEFNRCFGDRLGEQDREILERFLSIRGGLKERISYNAAMDVWRQSWVDTMILRAMILMGRA
jgi:glycosyltransferase involved in cell wall biosynthesis